MIRNPLDHVLHKPQLGTNGDAARAVTLRTRGASFTQIKNLFEVHARALMMLHLGRNFWSASSTGGVSVSPPARTSLSNQALCATSRVATAEEFK